MDDDSAYQMAEDAGPDLEARKDAGFDDGSSPEGPLAANLRRAQVRAPSVRPPGGWADRRVGASWLQG